MKIVDSSKIYLLEPTEFLGIKVDKVISLLDLELEVSTKTDRRHIFPVI